MLKKTVNQGARLALAGNISHFALAKEAGLPVICDMRLNVCNRYAFEAVKELGADDVILSAELTSKQVRDIGAGCVVYGRLPLMITEKCFMKDNFGCDKCGNCYLSDRKGIKFPMMREYRHRNLIFNSACTYMGDKREEIKTDKHFIFSVEGSTEVSEIIAAFKCGARYPFAGAFRRMGKRKTEI